MKSRVCELCKGEASLYCIPDSAFLCSDCDAKVHEANFLVARHVRMIICSRCDGFDGNRFSGVGSRPIRSLCRSCLPENGDSASSSSSSSSSSSTCLSSAESFTADTKKKIKKIGSRDWKNLVAVGKISRSSSVSELSIEESSKKKTLRFRISAKAVVKTKVDVKAEGILVNWNRRLGLQSSGSLPLALHAFTICLQKFTVLPFRVCLASSLWFSAKLCETRGPSTCQLKKLEQCSGVPVKLILLAESKLSRILKFKKSQQEAEGCAECSD
ncbi:B-box zinc finger protein 32-like [Tasmannia lanceolata]|uniref:B-box zinc finger protein 32-like n=1 Tax=Tasmannia lanceolata TaxID=3420 RepID=UPI0040632E3E